MKRFSCGDVVPGCTAKFDGASEDEILAQVAVHARDAHGITQVDAALIESVREKIAEVAYA